MTNSQDSMTPEWLQDLSVAAALENIIFDIGALAARLTMLQQRASDLLALITKEKNDDTNEE